MFDLCCLLFDCFVVDACLSLLLFFVCEVDWLLMCFVCGLLFMLRVVACACVCVWFCLFYVVVAVLCLLVWMVRFLSLSLPPWRMSQSFQR